MNNTVQRMLRLSLSTAILFVFGCADLPDTVLIQDLAVEVHDQVVEYSRPENAKGYSYEKIHHGGSRRFLLVFCSLRHDGRSQNGSFTGLPEDAVHLEDDNGLRYPCVGRAQNDRREYGQVIIQKPFGSRRVTLRPFEERKYSWLFDVPADMQSPHLVIAGHLGPTPIRVVHRLKLPREVTEAIPPEFVLKKSEIRSGSDFNLDAQEGNNLLLLTFEVRCPAHRKCVIVNTPAVTLWTARNSVIHPAGEYVRAWKRLTDHVSHAVWAGKPSEMTFCFVAPLDQKTYEVRFAGRPVYRGGVTPYAEVEFAEPIAPADIDNSRR